MRSWGASVTVGWPHTARVLPKFYPIPVVPARETTYGFRVYWLWFQLVFSLTARGDLRESV